MAPGPCWAEVYAEQTNLMIQFCSPEGDFFQSLHSVRRFPTLSKGVFVSNICLNFTLKAAQCVPFVTTSNSILQLPCDNFVQCALKNLNDATVPDQKYPCII